MTSNGNLRGWALVLIALNHGGNRMLELSSLSSKKLSKPHAVVSPQQNHDLVVDGERRLTAGVRREDAYAAIEVSKER